MSVRRSSDNKMSYRALSGVSALPLEPVEEVFPWKRNPSWLEIPPVDSTETKFVGLYAIEPDAAFCSISVGLDATGDYTIDWGDGTTDTRTVSGTTALVTYKQYDYSDSVLDDTDGPVVFQESGNLVIRDDHGYENGELVSFSVITGTVGIERFVRYYIVNATVDNFQLSLVESGDPISFTGDGTGSLLFYKQAIITVTAATGRQIRIFNLNVRHSLNNITYETGWLDHNFSFPDATTVTLSATSDLVRHSMLERSNPVNWGNATSLVGEYINNFNLQKVEDMTIPSTSSSLSSMFSSCINLYKTGNINNTSHVTNFSLMFTTCRNLRSLPFLDTSNATSMSGFSTNCNDLKSTPKFNLSSCSTVDSMFSNCIALQDVPPLDTRLCTNFTSMFNSCASLKYLNYVDTSQGNNISSFVLSCSLANDMPAYNLKNATNTTTALANLRCLRRLPPFDFSNATTVTSMFANNFTLKKTYDLNFNAAIAIVGLFDTCRAIRKLPTLRFGNNSFTSLNFTFRNCINLTSVPIFDTSNVTIFTSAFQGCSSLRYIHTFNTSSGTNFTSMFNACAVLRQAPPINLSNATILSNLFSGCTSLKEIPRYDLSSAVTADSVFRLLTVIDNIPPINLPVCTNASDLFRDSSMIFMPSVQVGGTNTNLTRMYYGMLQLIQVPPTNMSSSNNLTDIFLLSPSLKAIKSTGMRVSFTVATRNFSSTALNEIYTNLATVSGQTITVTANYGTTTDTPTIATSKGWAVTGS
jgi:hypothetical protein